MSNDTYPFSKGLRIHGKTPHVDITEQSLAFMIRDAIVQRVKTIPYFSTFNYFSTNKMLQIQPQFLPFCGVYFIQETGIPDGEANTGEVRFRTSARYGFSVIIINNDGEAAETSLDKAYTALTKKIFRDFTLYNNPNFKIQSFTNSSRQHIFGSMGQDNETPIAELRFEIIADLGTITYEPEITDDLETIHVETRFPVEGTAAEQAAVQQVIVQYDVEQNGD